MVASGGDQRHGPSFETEIRKTPEFRIAMLDAATAAKGYANAFAREFHAPWMPRP